MCQHIGETVRRDQFDALSAVGEDLPKLEQAKEKLGTNYYDSKLEAVHDRYITAFFRNLNAGHRKRLVPVWLKAPGGQMFYWGKLPRFSGGVGHSPQAACQRRRKKASIRPHSAAHTGG